MGPPGGGRNDVTSRFLSHFNIVAMNEFNEESMIKIFSTLMTTYMRVCHFFQLTLVHTISRICEKITLFFMWTYVENAFNMKWDQY